MLEIRHATHDDLQVVGDIRNHEIVSGVNAWDTVPLEGRLLEQWFENHSDRYPLLVAETTTGIVGWASLSSWAHHGAYDRTAEGSIYVHCDHRGRGVGRSLLREIIVEARRLGHHVLIARIEASNEVSRRLHLGAGFRSVGVMREVGYKNGRYLDAELLELLL